MVENDILESSYFYRAIFVFIEFKDYTPMLVTGYEMFSGLVQTAQQMEDMKAIINGLGEPERLAA